MIQVVAIGYMNEVTNTAVNKTRLGQKLSSDINKESMSNSER